MKVFVLDVATEPDKAIVGLRLADGDDVHLAAREFRLVDEPASLWEALFDTRAYVERFAGSLKFEGAEQPATANELLEHLGIELGQKVLGPDILGHLTESARQRTLLIRLPAPQADPLAAAFARVPWELARPGPGAPRLLESNLVVRAATAGSAVTQETASVSLEEGEALRVLLVFAEAPGTRPLAMRQERERLLQRFYRDILPRQRVQVTVLCHGVTRARLRRAITAAGGYHL